MNFSFRLFCAWISALTPTVATAECVGSDLLANAPASVIERMERDAAAQPFPEGRFWEVEKDGKTSVLFGTFHSPDDDISSIPAPLADRIAASDRLLIEMTRPEEQRMQRAMLLNPGMIINPGGQSIRPYFTDEEWTQLGEAMARIGHSAETIALLQPWFVSMALAVPPCILMAQFEGKLILDRKIEALANEKGVEVGGLEEYEAVLDIFRDGTFEEQIEMLKLSLPMVDDGEDSLETMKRLYLEGKIWQVWALNAVLAEEHLSPEEVQEMMDEMLEALIKRRNLAWMDRILPALAEGNTVIAVGALHLPGEWGLLNLLTQEGFETRRLDQ
jgi:uncharacterized protein